MMTVFDRVDRDYKFVIKRIEEDNELTDNQKKAFFDYSRHNSIDPSISSKYFERKVNKEFFYLNKSTLSQLNTKGIKINKKLGTVLSKTKFYQILKINGENIFPEWFDSESDFCSIIDTPIGYDIFKSLLGSLRFGLFVTWSAFNLNSKGFAFDNYPLERVPCVLGLDDYTISNYKYAIDHHFPKKCFKPSSFDAGFNEFWNPGGKTKPRKLAHLFSCNISECENCVGFDEVVHEPNSVKNIFKLIILE